MKKIFLLLLISIKITFHASAQDRSNYELAQHYQKQNNIVQAYKHLILFKFKNQDFLSLPAQAGTLKSLNQTIQQYEEVMTSHLSWYSYISGRSWSPGKTDSLLSASRKAIKIPLIQ